jgi:hypothetical protein
MRVIVTYYERDVYEIPDDKWQEAMADSKDDVYDAFEYLSDEYDVCDWFYEADIDDRWVETEAQGTEKGG